jgi:hypothetical protein
MSSAHGAAYGTATGGPSVPQPDFQKEVERNKGTVPALATTCPVSFPLMFTWEALSGKLTRCVPGERSLRDVVG